MPSIDQASSAEDYQGSEPPTRKSPLVRFLSVAVTILILWLVFGVVLPSIASYEDIWAAFTSMAVPTAIALIAAGLVLMVLMSLQLAAAQPGLRPWPAIESHTMAFAVGAVIPGGTIASRPVFLRPYGISMAAYTRSYAAAALGVTSCVLLMPAVGLVIYLVARQSPDAQDMRTFALVVSAIALVIAAGLLALLSSQALCRWCARTAAALVRRWQWLDRKLGSASWEDAVIAWRNDTTRALRERRSRLAGAVLATYWMHAALMIACMYACGLPLSAMGILTGLATFTIARTVLAVPLTPGGVGVLELGYSAVFASVVAEQFDESVVAGVLLYRALSYVMPVFLGGVLLLVTRLRRAAE